MKILSVLIFIILIFGLLSCSDNAEEPINLTINLKLENNGDPVVGFEAFSYPDGYNMFLTKFSLFLSDIELVDSENSSLQIQDVLFLDLLKDIQTKDAAENGLSFTVNALPAGLYKKFKVSIGVSPDFNAMSPSDFEISSVLSNSGEYWEGWSSYIFHKTEGKIDTDGDGEFETNIALHIGSDAAFRQAEYAINLDTENQNKLEMVIDINDIYKIGNDYYNFEETPQIHHIGLLPKALPIMDGLALEIEIR